MSFQDRAKYKCLRLLLPGYEVMNFKNFISSVRP